MVIIIALLIILAIIILLFSVRASVCLELKEELKLSVRVFGIKIKILPKKEKNYKMSDYTPKKIAKREAKRKKSEEKKAKRKSEKQLKKKAKKAELASLSKKEKRAMKKQKKESRPKIGDLVSLSIELLKLFFSTFFSHFHIKICKLHLNVGGADAAQVALHWYGIYAGCGAVIALMDKRSHLHGKNSMDIQIVPDYLSEEITADLKIYFSMNLFGLFCVLFKVAFKGIFGWIKIQPQK